MKAHIGVDTAQGLVHTLEATIGKVSDYSMADSCCMATRRQRTVIAATPKDARGGSSAR